MKNFMKKIINYENGEMEENETIAFFQELINEGRAWTLQGHYGRTAEWFIENGFCALGLKAKKTYWGQTIPSRFEITPGAPGSVEYVKEMTGKLPLDPASGKVLTVDFRKKSKL